MQEEALFNAREAARRLGVSLFTLNKIEEGGDLVPFRTPGLHRRYNQKLLNDYLKKTKAKGRKTAS